MEPTARLRVVRRRDLFDDHVLRAADKDQVLRVVPPDQRDRACPIHRCPFEDGQPGAYGPASMKGIGAEENEQTGEDHRSRAEHRRRSLGQEGGNYEHSTSDTQQYARFLRSKRSVNEIGSQ